MRFLAGCLFLSATSFAADLTPREIVRRSLEVDEANRRGARNYTFVKRAEERGLDSRGKVKSTESKTWDVTLLEGAPHERLIREDDQPLSPKKEEKERQKLDKSVAESPEKRARRVAEYREEREKRRRAAAEIPDAYHFKLLGEEVRDGHRVWVIAGEPKPDWKPKSRDARFFSKIRGKLWIDMRDYHWVRVEAEIIDTVSFGWFLLRLKKGSHMEARQTLVHGEVWLPRFVRVVGSVKLGLIKNFYGEQITTYSDYRKFQTDSRIISTLPRPAGPGPDPKP